MDKKKANLTDGNFKRSQLNGVMKKILVNNFAPYN